MSAATQTAAPRQGARARLLAAARALFCAEGYFGPSVEEIVAAAGVSRMTFYRHFAGKAALAAELFHAEAAAAEPRLLAIRERDWRDAGAVRDWIAMLFDADRAHRNLLHVFIQAAADEGEFAARAQTLLDALIAGLGQRIPAFRLDPGADRRRWLEAWLLLYELLDQSNHAARRSGIAADPLVIDILAERFLRFVAGEGGAVDRPHDAPRRCAPPAAPG